MTFTHKTKTQRIKEHIQSLEYDNEVMSKMIGKNKKLIKTLQKDLREINSGK